MILHGVPKRITSNQGSVFTRRFWTSFQEALVAQLNFSTTYHPKKNRHTEGTNQTLEYFVVHVRDIAIEALGRVLPTSRVCVQKQLSKYHQDGTI